MSTEVGTRYSYSHIRAVLDTSTLGEIRSITDPSPRRHRAHSTLTQTQNFISHIHRIHHGGWRCNNLPCRPTSLLRPTSDTVGPSMKIERRIAVRKPRRRPYQAVLKPPTTTVATLLGLLCNQVGSTKSWMPDAWPLAKIIGWSIE